MLNAHIRNALAAIAVGTALAAAGVIPALASNSGNGSDYGTMPGYAVANSETVCAGHGSFDAFGKDANLGNFVSGHATFLGSYPGPGTDGAQTGLNNSGLCGNRQGNL